jgi:glucose/arabinose dehydrogenase
MSFLILTAIISAQTAAPFTTRTQPVASDLVAPLLVTNAKDGSKRLFIVQQGGIIKAMFSGSKTTFDFMNITPKVLSGGEQGLLGLAFHPQFATNGYFFVNYTRTGDGATVIARYKTTSSVNALGDPNSERILLVIPQPFSNHNGGMIEFRNDNGVDNLYIGMGDGGAANDPGNRAQNINELLGKFLRITPDVSGNSTAPAYTVPADNPFVGTAGADEIYAVGLRNPFRWSFDRGGTRQLWAGDVGQGSLEEVDIITRGGNFGWRVYEGTQCTGIDAGLCNPVNYIPPVFQYSSAAPSPRCSVTGGYVYRGGLGAFPNGAYIYGDFCTGEVLMWNGSQQLPVLSIGSFDLSSFGEDEDGELYVCGIGSGTVRKFVRAKASADFDGDLKTDFSVFRPSNGVWYRLNSSNGSFSGTAFGQTGDIPTPEDFDGDNIVDIAVFRPSNGTWYYLRSSDGTFAGVQFGASGDVPAAGDYDGDAKADFTVFRPSNGVWYVLNSRNGLATGTAFGQNGDKPTAGDYDGDGRYDIAVFRPSNGVWYRNNSVNTFNSGVNNNFSAVAFGAGSDIPAQGDFDGDGRTDQAVFRPSTGVWYVLRSSNNASQATTFGANGDIPAVGDYDGDGLDDIAVFRPSNGTWYALQSTNGQVKAAQFGASGDLPVPTYDLP